MAVIGDHVGVLRERTGTASRVARWTANPAVARRQRLASVLHRSDLAQLMIAMALIATAGLLYLGQASQVSVLQFNIADLQTQQQQLAIQNANLHAEATTLQSPHRIDQVATQQLRMSPPDLSKTVWISPTIPRLTPPASVDTSTIDAQRDSQPLAWISRFAQFVKSSL